MSFMAYFDASRRCIAVMNSDWPGGGYAHSVDVEAFRSPDDIYWNGTGAGTRLADDMTAFPDTVVVGAVVDLYAPTQSVLVVNGVNEGSHYAISATAPEGKLFLMLGGKYKGEKLIELISLTNRKTAKMAELSTIFDAHISGGCTSPLGWVDCDDKARYRLAAIMNDYTYFGVSTGTSTDITMYDQSKISHTYAQILALGAAITTAWHGMFANKQSLEDAIIAASDAATLEAIDLESGWP